MGVELIGDASPDGDAEMIALAVETLKAGQVKPFKLAIGHVGFLHAFLQHQVEDDDFLERLINKLNEHDYVGYRQLVAQLPVSRSAKQRLHDLLSWRGGGDTIVRLLQEATSVEEQAALEHLRQLWEALEMYGVTPFMSIDFSLIGKMNYYTGVYFEGYADRVGFPLLSGGRYDALLQRFGRPAPAIGFQLKVDRLLEISSPERDKLHHVLIIYEPSERREAIYMAAKWRRKNNRVTMQVSTQLDQTTLEVYEQRYDELIVLRGEADAF